MTNSKPPDDAKETTHQAFSIAQDTAQNAPSTREENTCAKTGSWSFLARSSSGAALGAFFASKRRKEPDAVQAVRDGGKKLWKSSLSNGPKPTNKHALSKMISSPRLRVSARSCISGRARPAPDYSPHPAPLFTIAKAAKLRYRCHRRPHTPPAPSIGCAVSGQTKTASEAIPGRSHQLDFPSRISSGRRPSSQRFQLADR